MGGSRSDFGSSVEEKGVKEIPTWLNGVRDSGFIMQHGEAAQAALHVGIDALEWPDSGVVHKTVISCAAVVNVTALAGDSQLPEVFSAVIRGLSLESNASAAELIGLLQVDPEVMDSHRGR